MSEAATETPTKPRRWNAFVCPGCRLLFRVPRDPEGRGVVCPNCRRLMRLPQKGDKLPELFSGAGSAAPAAGLPAGSGERRHHHSRPGLLGRIRNRLIGRSGSSQTLLVVMSIGVLVAFGAVIAVISLVGGGVERADEVGGSLIDLELPVTGTGDAGLLSGGADDPDPGTSMTIEPGTFLPRAETMARRLVDARSVRDMLPLVRDPEVAGPRMRDWFARHGFEGRRIHKFAERGGLSFRGRVVGVPLVTDDFERWQMAFVVDGDSLLIDWESWVGWSEMGWSEFMDKRPVETKEFRVFATQGVYFNFGFAENDGWHCYELESPDRKLLLYGYGRIGSEADGELRGVEKSRRGTFTLGLRYPENAAAANQVIIESFLAKGWVIGADG